jgi:hypothetical protein
MQLDVKYRNKIATTDDVDFINQLIKENPEYSRWRLSKELCIAWDWKQANGVLCDMVCRGFLLELDRHGYIKLPPKKHNPPNPFVNRVKPAPISIDTTPIRAKVSEVQPLRLKQVRRTSSEKLFNGLISKYHYLGYSQPVGEHLKYIVYAKDRPIACFAFSSAPRHIGSRDRFIGWKPFVRKKNIHLIAYNTRFLILPWIQIPHLASHLLGRIVKVIGTDWKHLYNHPVYILETFVDTEKFKGTCYKAANWKYLGNTTGRGKNDLSHKINRSIKAVWAYPLSKHFREKLQYVPA